MFRANWGLCEKPTKHCPSCGIETTGGYVCRSCKRAAKHGHVNARQCTNWTKDKGPSRFEKQKAIIYKIYRNKKKIKALRPLVDELNKAVDIGRLTAHW